MMILMILAKGKKMDRIEYKILTVHRLLLELVLLQRLQSLRREAEIIQIHICKTVMNNLTFLIYILSLYNLRRVSCTSCFGLLDWFNETLGLLRLAGFLLTSTLLQAYIHHSCVQELCNTSPRFFTSPVNPTTLERWYTLYILT